MTDDEIKNLSDDALGFAIRSHLRDYFSVNAEGIVTWLRAIDYPRSYSEIIAEVRALVAKPKVEWRNATPNVEWLYIDGQHRGAVVCIIQPALAPDLWLTVSTLGHTTRSGSFEEAKRRLLGLVGLVP